MEHLSPPWICDSFCHMALRWHKMYVMSLQVSQKGWFLSSVSNCTAKHTHTHTHTHTQPFVCCLPKTDREGAREKFSTLFYLLIWDGISLLLPRLECSGLISAPQVQVILLPQPPKYLGLQSRATTPGWFFVFLVEMGFHHVGQASLELPTSGDLPALPSQNAGITGVSHHARPSSSSDWSFTWEI